ncbi:MAG TPA: bifunctional UDP-4-keto-pentose/UDP-xylose synthase [Bryobacteraceae bacterium]|nr:bifunctional UDP-4-keto-pentose/UDP-xylose synthase [Bryobacteraceae bacterium]
MKILSLGAGGFIGSHLTHRLLQEGHVVTAVDLETEKVTDCLEHPNLTFFQHDIRKPGWDLDALVRESDLVIDLIAYANPGLYIRIPLEVFRLNFTENLKIAEACVRQRKRLIQFSTCEVYGRSAASLKNARLTDPEDPIHATYSEDSSECILGPVSKHRWIYSCAKQLLERVLHAYGIEEGFNYTIIRPFNFIGPKIDFLLHEKEGIPRVFSFFMDALLNGTQMKLVNGGTARRCYTYIDDAIECTYRVVQNPGGVCDRQILNIGSPYNEVSIRQMAELMRDIYVEKFRDPSVRLPDIVSVSGEEFYGEGYDDSDRRIPDITKVRKLLGWEPKWNIRDTLETTMQYYVSDYRKNAVGSTAANG